MSWFRENLKDTSALMMFKGANANSTEQDYLVLH